MRIETEKFEIFPLNYKQLKSYIVPNELEKDLGLIQNLRTVAAKTARKIAAVILPEIATDNDDFIFKTFWLIVLKHEQTIVAEICFKGKPTQKGEVEIGYATYDAFKNKGIMTAALHELINWIFKNTVVKTIIAETDPANFASHRTLEKNGFKKIESYPDNLVWHLEKLC